MLTKRAPAIGIDLGTTYSCVGVFRNGNVEIIANDHGNRTTPSYVAFTDTWRLLGESAKSQVARNPENTIYDVKRLIGRKYYDENIELDLKNWPFQVVDEGVKPKICAEFRGEKKLFNPEQISAMVLTKMKQTAEMHLKQEIVDAVISVPANFSYSQKQATIDAGKIAGLNVLGIINEPTAAALAYALEKDFKGENDVMVVDIGAGTLDVSILTIFEGGKLVGKSTAGNTHLGGEDFDNRLVDHFIEEFKMKHGKDMRRNPRSVRRLRTACESAKLILSSNTNANIEIDSLFEGIDFYSKISRDTFEGLCNDIFKSILKYIERALEEIDKNSIDDIILVGGSTRIPKVRKFLKEFFNGKQLCVSINPDEAVANGAAIQAAVLAGSLDEKFRRVHILDVVPLSLGIETAGGVMRKIIERNCHVPFYSSYTITTSRNNQSVLNIKVFEGEEAKTEDNHLILKYRLSDIPPAAKGVSRIKVVLDIDWNYILKVTAQEISNAEHQKIRVTNIDDYLWKEEFERMLNEATEYEKVDAETRYKVSLRNTLESYINSVKPEAATDPDDKLSATHLEKIKDSCKYVIHWLDCNPLAEKNAILKKMIEVRLDPLMVKAYQDRVEMNYSQRSKNSEDLGVIIEEIY